MSHSLIIKTSDFMQKLKFNYDVLVDVIIVEVDLSFK